jgi:hypothetical protein
MNIESLKSCDTLMQRHGNIVATIEFPCIKHDLLRYINQHGKLYCGTLISSEFQKIFNHDKTHILSVLKSIKNRNEITPDIQRVWFHLHLIRECIKNSWRWPAIANEINEKLYFYTGLGRLISTGMCQPDPWKKLNVLLYCPNDASATHQLFENLQPITDIDALHQILKLNYSTEIDPNSEPELHLSFRHEHNHSLVLTQMYDGNQTHHYHAGQDYLEDLLAWKDIYGLKPTLKLYTDWPEKIVDSQQAWNIIHAGPSPDIKIRENFLFNQFNNLAESDHVFYVTTPRRLDVTELLGWINLKSTSYISVNWEFALITPGKEYRSYLFDLSYI